MPRNPTAPPLPYNPATWLANFRYRLIGENGERWSPESLGYRMGVSGATVRRWEAGQSNPSDDDLLRFAEVCRLSPHQREFIFRLFARGAQSATTTPKNFRHEASAVLSTIKCACLIDELFFIRAWNGTFAREVGSYADELPDGVNAIRLSLEMPKRADPVLEQQRVRSIVRQMWIWTAHLAATPAYSALVNELLQYESFATNWEAIIAEDHEQDSGPLAMPVLQGETDRGGFSVYTGELLFPPLYRMLICVPSGTLDGANEGDGPVDVFFSDQLHWSE
ncbi:MAG: helix-turn-helix domain-containing protein [Dehalococcoidia bacterium]